MLPVALPPTLHQTSPTQAKLPEPSRKALLEALEDERRAQARYQAVIAKFGEVHPFSQIVRAEARHQDELLSLFRSYGVPVPLNTWRDHPPAAPDTLAEACAEGVKGEEVNIAMYDRLLGVVKEADLRAVFLRLQAASRDHHLPAFRACAGAYPRKP